MGQLQNNYKGCIPSLPSAASAECSHLFVLVTIQAAECWLTWSFSLSFYYFYSFFSPLVSRQPNITLVEPIKMKMWFRFSSFIFSRIFVYLRLNYALWFCVDQNIFWCSRLLACWHMYQCGSSAVMKNGSKGGCYTSEHWIPQLAFEHAIAPVPLKQYALSVTDSAI